MKTMFTALHCPTERSLAGFNSLSDQNIHRKRVSQSISSASYCPDFGLKFYCRCLLVKEKCPLVHRSRKTTERRQFHSKMQVAVLIKPLRSSGCSSCL
jgi:hypothetical protein